MDNSNEFPAWRLESRYDTVPDLPVLEIGRAHV